MPEPVLEAIERYSKDLDRLDIVARNTLLGSFRRQIAPVLLEWRALQEKVATAPLIATIDGSGNVTQAIPPSWLFQEQRYASLQSEVRGLVYGMGATLGDVTLEGQAAAWETGLQEARAAGTALGEISPRSWAGVPSRAFASFTGGEAGGPLGSLLAGFTARNGGEARAFARDVIGAGVIQGLAARDVARRLEAGLSDLTFGRAYRIARTETLRAYREGARASYRANPNIVQSWAWRAAVENTSRPPCAACFARHGQLFPIEEPMQTHPNCRCRMVPRRSPLFGVQPNDPKLPDATAAFEKLSPAQQRRILGPGRLEMYRRGQANLRDFATVRGQGGPWGANAATVRPLYELRNLSHEGRALPFAAQRLFTQSAEAERFVSGTLQDVAYRTGGSLEGFAFRLKRTNRIAEKIQTDVLDGRGGVTAVSEGINDALRYTMRFSPEQYADGVRIALREIETRGGVIVNSKNFWNTTYTVAKHGADSGYRGFHAIIRDRTGARYELQFHTAESLAVKEPSHNLYEIQRQDSTSAAEKKRLAAAIGDLWRTLRFPPGALDL